MHMCICPCIACTDVMYRGQRCFFSFSESVYISVCSEITFLFSQEEQHALLLRMLTVSLRPFFFFPPIFPFLNELVYKVQVLSIA